MILIQLDEATRDELKSLRRQELPPRVRDRLEMVLLSSVAWSPARIATHLGYCAATVRSVLGVTILPMMKFRACAPMSAGIEEGEVKETLPIMSVDVDPNWRNLVARDDETAGTDSNGSKALHSADVNSGISRAGGPKDDVRPRSSRRAKGQWLDAPISATRRWE